MPVMLGVLAGSLLERACWPPREPAALRLVFAVVMVLLAIEMIDNGLRGRYEGAQRSPGARGPRRAVVGNVLRAGDLLAGSMVLVGAVLYLVRHGSRKPQLHVFWASPRISGRSPASSRTSAGAAVAASSSSAC